MLTLFSGQVKEGTRVSWPNYSTPGCIPRVRHIHITREKDSSKMSKSSCHSMDRCQEHHIEEQKISCGRNRLCTVQSLAKLSSGAELASLVALHTLRLCRGSDADPRPPGQPGPDCWHLLGVLRAPWEGTQGGWGLAALAGGEQESRLRPDALPPGGQPPPGQLPCSMASGPA